MHDSVRPLDDPVEKLGEAGYPPPPPHADRSLPPGGGGLVLPPFQTFSQIVNYVSRTYRFRFDEALRHSEANARAARRDPVVMDAVRSRQMPTAQLAWHLESIDDTDQRQVQLADAITDSIKAIPSLQTLLMQLLEAIWFGRYAVQMTYAWDFVGGKRRLTVRSHEPIHGDKLVFRFSGQAGVLVHATFPGDWQVTDRGRAHFFTPEEREQLVIHHHEPEDADFFEPELAGGRFGVGIRSRIYWLWWLKSQVFAYLMDYLERVGAGGFTIYYYESGNAASLEEVQDAAEKQLRNNVILFPRYRDNTTGGPGVQRIEPGTAGASLLGNLVGNYFDSVIRRYILGQELSSSAKATGLGSGLADLHADTFSRIVKYDATALQETLTRDLVAVLARYTAPGVPPPRFVFDVDKPNAVEVLEAARAFYEMGGEIDADELRGVLGLAKPEPGHAVLSKLPNVSPAGIGALPTGVPMSGVPGPDGMPQYASGEPPEASSGGPWLFDHRGTPLRFEANRDRLHELASSLPHDEPTQVGGDWLLNDYDHGPAVLRHVPLEDLHADQDYLRDETVETYRDQIRSAGGSLPREKALKVFYRGRTSPRLHIHDGHHRAEAARPEGLTHAPAWVSLGRLLPTSHEEMSLWDRMGRQPSRDDLETEYPTPALRYASEDEPLRFALETPKDDTEPALDLPITPVYAPRAGVYLGRDFYQGGEQLPRQHLASLSERDRRKLLKHVIHDHEEAAKIFGGPDAVPSKKREAGRYAKPSKPDLPKDDWLPDHISRYLRSDEIAELKDGHARKLVQLYESLPPEEEFVAAAEAGAVKRGWYRSAADAISTLYGEEAPRFAALLAATSPRVSVRDNLYKAAGVWSWYQKQLRRRGYTRRGKLPTHKQVRSWIKQERGRIVDRVHDSKGKEVNLTAWDEITGGGERTRRHGLVSHDANIARALSDTDPGRDEIGVLSGFKVDSFRRNLLGHLDAVTNDAWIAHFGDTDPKHFGKAHGYFAMNARIRGVAERLGMEPAEVQETIWSFFRTLAFIGAKSRTEGTPQSAKGPLDPIQALKATTPADLDRTADFASLLVHDDAIQQRLRQLGPEFERRLDALAERAGGNRKDAGDAKPQTPPRNRAAILGRIARRAGRRIGAFIGGRIKERRGGDRFRFAQTVPAIAPSPDDLASAGAAEGDAWTMFPPNVEEGGTFEQAYSRLRTANHAAYREIAQDVYKAAGLEDVSMHDAVGDWSDGAEPSFLARVGNDPDYETVRYTAAWQGLLGNQTSVLLFRAADDGPDAVYQVHVPETSASDLRMSLDRLGIQYRTIVPIEGGHVVVLYDEGRKLRDAVQSFASQHDASVREASGTGEYLGGTTRTAARAAYRRVIRSYESGRSAAGRGSGAGPAAVRAGAADDPTQPPSLYQQRRVGPRRRFAAKAPSGGAVIRGVAYQGGKFLPTTMLDPPRAAGPHRLAADEPEPEVEPDADLDPATSLPQPASPTTRGLSTSTAPRRRTRRHTTRCSNSPPNAAVTVTPPPTSALRPTRSTRPQ